MGEVFELLMKHQLWLNPKKYKFSKRILIYLGFIIGGGRTQINPDKVKAM